MDNVLFDAIVAHLLPEMDDKADRKAMVMLALRGSPVLDDMDWEGPAKTFTTLLVNRLDTFGDVAIKQPANVALLIEHRTRIGMDRQSISDDLIAQLMPVVDGAQTWDVFISYQRDSETEARELFQHLSDEGFKVWQDVNNIRHTTSWSQSIDTALRKTKRLVLMMTPPSMASWEVFNEWFFFYNKQKPIHCLMLETCEPHYQLLPYQYLDWRDPDTRDWERLFAELRADFSSPWVITPSPIVSMPQVDAAPATDGAFVDLLRAVRASGHVAFTEEQIKQLVEHKPANTEEYRLGRIAEWSQTRYALDTRFVNLILLLDKGEDAQRRWQTAEDSRFNDLRDVLKKVEDRALVVLGAPGSGKSTLLRRFQMDHSLDTLRNETEQITFFIQLNAYRDDDPREWLNARWADRYPTLAVLDEYLRQGRLILLLDALNEMPHSNTAEYYRKVDLWRSFTQETVKQGNRVIFSCRSLDYSASLSSPDLRVPQIEVQPMSSEQVKTFIEVYRTTHAERIWTQLDGSPQFDLFRTPIYLKILLDLVEPQGDVPGGKAELFTKFVRQQLNRNINNPLFSPNGLLSERDHRKLANEAWKTSFELPERGLLVPSLGLLAFTMQESNLESEGALVRIDYDDACDLLEDSGSNEDILKAGVALNVLDEDLASEEITFFHQLLQEFFAARRLAKAPNPELVHVKWHVDHVTPTLNETLDSLADGDPLPSLAQTGWEETTLTAAPMTKYPNAFIRDLMTHNLPLAARCAASPEIALDPVLKRQLQDALIQRTQNMDADLRARIAAGLALGEIGDPRFVRKTGSYGDYLLPPMVKIPAGTYTIGDDNSPYDFEKPTHKVMLDAFELGVFPVTNAEYALFMAAGGYQSDTWWDTDEAQKWLSGETTIDGQKEQWRISKKTFESWSESYILGMVDQNRITKQQAEDWIKYKNWTQEQFEEELESWYPTGTMYRQPKQWDDLKFNNPAQPIVGVTWFEAKAYCNWLSAQTGRIFRLVSEVEFEAAARGRDGKIYPYGEKFDPKRSNTFETRIRKSTPIGIFNNSTPSGLYDMVGNVYTWTLSIYDEEKYPYPYQVDDGRESINSIGRRVLRGGSWYYYSLDARTTARHDLAPSSRGAYYGFRLCCEL